MLARLFVQSQTRPDASLRRALCVAAVIVFWMLAVSARLVYLQVSRHDSLVEQARQQQRAAIDTSPQRGQILDRQDRELARSVDTASIFVAPDELKRATEAETEANIECTAHGLSSVLALDKKVLFSQLDEARVSGRRFLWIARRLSPEMGVKIRALELPGVHLEKEQKRYYPNDSLAAHVLGFVGLDKVGLGGVEQFYNEKITGEPGKLYLERDSEGKSYESLEIPSKPGQTIVLTIDQSIQYRTEQALTTAVKQSRAKSGTAIVLEPHTGEILALANAPTFNPNNPGAAPPQVRSNWALQGMYEPGSTFKIVAYSAAIERGLVKPEDHIDCQMGAITVAGRLIHDHHRFGTLTIAEALAKSSNVAAIKLGLRVGDNSMYDYITRFGFGARTGIELPGETAGSVRPVRRWQASSIGSIAMGQEIGVTPLQMAAAYGALANDGVRVAPHIVREIRADSGTVVYRANAEQRRVISQEAAKALRGMLEGVTLNGTARKAQLNGYTAAGKTGTAQKIDPKTKTYSRTKYVGSFVGFAPVENPAIVIIVVIDEPTGSYHGGDVAAPVFREIAEQILPDLGIAPDTEIKSPPELFAQVTQHPEVSAKMLEEQAQVEETRQATLPQLARSDEKGAEIVYAIATSRAILMPDFRGRSVRDVARACAQLGLQVEAHGEGRAMRQSPSQGTELESGQVVYLDFARVN
jgi:cell division protein FtsI/penicillin-binding protein 2